MCHQPLGELGLLSLVSMVQVSSSTTEVAQCGESDYVHVDVLLTAASQVPY